MRCRKTGLAPGGGRWLAVLRRQHGLVFVVDDGIVLARFKISDDACGHFGVDKPMRRVFGAAVDRAEFSSGKQLHLTGRRDRDRASGNAKVIWWSFSLHAAIILFVNHGVKADLVPPEWGIA